MRRGRSRVTNGRLFIEHDGRGPWTRRFKDILTGIVDDLKTTNETLSEGQRQLARRAATIAIACEKLEGQAAGTLTDRLGRTFHRLGLKRASRQRGDAVDRYLEAQRRSAS